MEDVPHWPDREGLDLTETDDECFAVEGHKLGGWPHWVQGAERVSCPDCGTVMTPFIQLDQSWNQNFNFGGGVGHISQCPNHPDTLAFGWACT